MNTLNFSDGGVGFRLAMTEADGEEASGVMAWRNDHGIPPPKVTNGPSMVYYDDESFVPADDISWITQLTEKIAESGKSVNELYGFFKPAALKLLEVLELPETFFFFAVSCLADMLDPSVDICKIDDGDPWRWNRRYPRLSKLAGDKNFREFQTALAKFIHVPDLAKPQRAHHQHHH